MTRWLAALLVLVTAAAGWLGWREYQWRQTYFAEMTGELIYHVEMARRQLTRAREAQDYEQRLDALSAAHAYLVPAQKQAYTLLERLVPVKPGQRAFMPTTDAPMLLQWARELSPDMPDEALARRVDLVGGLEQALRAGLGDTVVQPGFAFQVDNTKLKRSLEGYFGSLADGITRPAVLTFEDLPNLATASAKREGDQVHIQLDWAHTYRLFPPTGVSQLILVRPGAGIQVASSAGTQQRMGRGTLEPFTAVDPGDGLHGAIEGALPADWSVGSYMAIRVPEGLAQTLALRLPAGARPEVLRLRLGSGERAVPIPVRQ